MLSDTNRTGLYDPNRNGFGRNVLGSCASIQPPPNPPAPIPLPAAIWLLGPGIALLGLARRHRPKHA